MIYKSIHKNINVSKETYNFYMDFKNSFGRKKNDEFIKFLITSNLHYIEYINKRFLSEIKEEYLKLCEKETPKLTFEQFKEMKIKEKLVRGIKIEQKSNEIEQKGGDVDGERDTD